MQLKILSYLKKNSNQEITEVVTGQYVCLTNGGKVRNTLFTQDIQVY